MAQVNNVNDKIFPELRKIFSINDKTLIPFVAFDKFMPYSNDYEINIRIRFNDSNELNTITNFGLEYEEIEITTPLKNM